MIDFYRAHPAGGGIFIGAKHGPFPVTAGPGAVPPFYANTQTPIIGRVTTTTARIGKGSRRATLFPTHRVPWWPGIAKEPQPARGSLTCPAPAGITDHSTLTLNDGTGAVIFELCKTMPGIVPGAIAVDLTTAVTATDVANTLAFTIQAYTSTLYALAGTINGGSPGFQAQPRGVFVDLIQAIWSKMTVLLVGPANLKGITELMEGAWIYKTTGQWGNNAIVASVPGEWTGRIVGMVGGRAGRGGLFGVANVARQQHIQAPAFVPQFPGGFPGEPSPG